ncbi:hypothetical protein MTsPCn9_05800 [Croceitalea sp. MTPC9]|uniref:hypothetical protein n=1 Tax=unclassified Croceitalea TaxID=2632280 RepID=UPI002B373E10|nr:hypothetical protein MTsPCn6_02910 [Croceitalea sp. MTPC6]GMN15644.1 hypothetical protein MTsPCn9_05800 [Croceitalea sp. MTPC9]
MIKRILKIIGILTGVVLLGLFIYGWIINEPLPKGKSGAEADALAAKMLKAINYDSYKQTRFIEWSFRNDSHHYKWDKENGIVEVKWSNKKVVLDLSNLSKSKSYEGGKAINDVNSKTLIDDALDKFNNDSFWLVAPYKVFDKGTKRGIVELEDGSKGLLVTYTKGGTTPGDSYLWKLNPNGFPNSFQMWVKIIPIGGLEASWDDWIITSTGAYLPKSHKFGPVNLSIGNIKGYN